MAIKPSGNVCPACALRMPGATFVSRIFSLAPILSSPWEVPQVDRSRGGILALRAHCALLLDYVPPEEPLGTPLGNTLRIRRPNLDWRGP